MKSSRVFLLPLLLTLGVHAAPQGASPATRIDQAVASIPGFDAPHAAARSDDAEFLRRVMLDLVGYPPNTEESVRFVADRSPMKREKKVDELLACSRFADFWARRFAEVFFGNYHEPRFDLPSGLRIETKVRLLGNFIAWLKEGLRQDRPWSDIVTDMIIARGSTASVPELGYKLSFYDDERQEFSFAGGVSRHFLGIALQCARCHDHPYDKWRVEEFNGLAAFNTRQRASRVVLSGEEQVEVTYLDEGELEFKGWGGRGGSYGPTFLTDRDPGKGDRVKTLAQLMTQGKNKYMVRSISNRLWAWMMGRGIVEPVDDLSLKNQPVWEPLFSVLTQSFEEGNGSIKGYLRLLCATETYQRSSEASGSCDRRHFCRGRVSPLTSEQLLNSIQVATRGTPGLDLVEAQQLTVALTPRPQVGCEVQPLAYGTLHALMLRNSQQIWDWIRNGGVLAEIRKRATTDEEVVEQMFVAALSRKPEGTERIRYANFMKDRGDNGIADAYWSLINTTEFLTRH
jgi:hypothetical protein